MKALMKTGDFAQLCRTTKETLRHYDQLGLLCPVERAKTDTSSILLHNILTICLFQHFRVPVFRWRIFAIFLAIVAVRDCREYLILKLTS